MREVHVDALRCEKIPLGYAGENEVTKIIFSVKEAVEKFGDGDFILLVERSGDEQPYSAMITRVGNTVEWVVKSSDVQIPGIGRCELALLISGRIAKSIVYQTITAQALGNDAEPPEPWEPWVNEILEAAELIKGHTSGTEGQVWTKTETGAGWANSQGGPGGELWLPSVAEDGEISWTRSDTETPPAPQNIKGPQGQQGIQGIQGPPGQDGAPGQKGADGDPGVYVGSDPAPEGTRVQVDPGGEAVEIITRDDYDPVAKTDTMTNPVGVDSDGKLYTAPAESNTLWYPTVSASGDLSWEKSSSTTPPTSRNIKGPQGATGAAGHTPVKGTDYWTSSDKQGIVNDVVAALPTWTGGSY